MRANAQRINALRVALAFGRADVDQFLSELTHEEYEEWAAYFQLEPYGWQATRLQTARLSYMVAQAATRKRLKESQFDIKTALPLSPEAERARWEAMAIRQNIANGG